jgi:hypothetical protein
MRVPIAIFLDRRRRRAGSASGPIQAGANPAPDAQRCIIDRNLDRIYAQRAINPRDFDFEIKACTKGNFIDRARNRTVGPTAENNRHNGSGADIGHRHSIRNHRLQFRSFAGRNTCALQHAAQTIAAAERSRHFNARAFRRSRKRFHRFCRGHPASCIAAQSQRCDCLRSGFVPLRLFHRLNHGWDSLDTRCHQKSRAAQRRTGQGTAPPGPGANLRAEIDDKIEIAPPANRCSRAQRFAEIRTPGGSGDGRVDRKRSCAAAL